MRATKALRQVNSTLIHVKRMKVLLLVFLSYTVLRGGPCSAFVQPSWAEIAHSSGIQALRTASTNDANEVDDIFTGSSQNTSSTGNLLPSFIQAARSAISKRTKLSSRQKSSPRTSSRGPRPDSITCVGIDEKVEALLAASCLVYSLASLRKAITANERLPDNHPQKKILHCTELIMADKHVQPPVKSLGLDITEYEYNATVIEDFINMNREFVESLQEVDTKDGTMNIYHILSHLKQIDAGFVEFDDQFSRSECVYGITINRTKKRIVVFFRGSVPDSSDWPTNLNARKVKLDVPRQLASLNESIKDEIQVHKGFYLYMNRNLDKDGFPFNVMRRDEENVIGMTKFEQIQRNLVKLLSMSQFEDYEVLVSGHSLGGALAQLLAYQLATNGQLEQFQNALPITAITFASPNVGNKGFKEAFWKLSDMDLIRHIRVTNEGDVVPVFYEPLGYTQTGLNFYLRQDLPMILDYSGKFDSLKYQVKTAYQNGKQSVWGMVDQMNVGHSPVDYYRNLFGLPENRQILSDLRHKTRKDLIDELLFTKEGDEKDASR